MSKAREDLKVRDMAVPHLGALPKPAESNPALQKASYQAKVVAVSETLNIFNHAGKLNL